MKDDDATTTTPKILNSLIISLVLVPTMEMLNVATLHWPSVGVNPNTWKK
jgi:hypothetical protein